MSDEKNESAFPTLEHNPLFADSDGAYLNMCLAGGLSKRELFSAMAMQGLCAIKWEGMLCDAKYKYENAAQDAVEYADALILELAKGEDK